MDENQLSYLVIGAAINVHKNVGPGLLESAYEHALAYECRNNGLEVRQQVPIPFIYQGVKLDIGYRVDLIINNKIILEIKSVEGLQPVHYAQLLTYLRLADLKLGLLINFNCFQLKSNIHRIVNKL